VAKELYLEHGWDMPKGFIDKQDRNPLNFTREEWQQARRTEQDPKILKHMLQECWAISDSRKAYIQALQSKGFALARGDRRGFVAVDYRGEVYVIARYTGIKAKQVKEKLGDPKNLASIEEAKAKIGTLMSKKLKAHLEQTRKEQKQRSVTFQFQRKQLVEHQREERAKLKKGQEAQWNVETRARSERLAKGLRGIWHRFTGKYTRVKRQNKRETLLAYQRDRKKKDTLIFRHMKERKKLQQQTQVQKKSHAQKIEQLRQDISRYKQMKPKKPLDLKKELKQAKKEKLKKLKQDKSHKPDKGPELEI